VSSKIDDVIQHGACDALADASKKIPVGVRGRPVYSAARGQPGCMHRWRNAVTSIRFEQALTPPFWPAGQTDFVARISQEPEIRLSQQQLELAGLHVRRA
jgi:hypothetical protein